MSMEQEQMKAEGLRVPVVIHIMPEKYRILEEIARKYNREITTFFEDSSWEDETLCMNCLHDELKNYCRKLHNPDCYGTFFRFIFGMENQPADKQ